MIVVDASAVAELILATAIGAAVARRLRGEALHAPAHVDVEVAGVLRRAVQRDLITDHEGLVALGDYRDLSIRRWLLRPLLGRAYALRHTQTVADAAYVALAEGLAAPLLTSDARLARSHGHHARIELP